MAAGIIALQNVRDLTTYRIYGHMSNSAIPWHHSHFKNAYFLDADAAKVRSIRKACAYGKQRQTGTDSNQVHRLLPTVQEQSFSIDDFTCTHHSIRGYKYCDVMRDNAMQMIYILQFYQVKCSRGDGSVVLAIVESQFRLACV